MNKFDIGSKVIECSSEEHGVVIEVMPPRRGRQLYKVKFDSRENYVLEADLMPDCDISDPFERCSLGAFGSYSDFAQKNTTFKIRNSNNSTISSLKASKTLFRAYQFKPLLKFLNSPNRRLLVADEVGLGKTIEAGHIMLELKARQELNHVLIVCPKSLRNKWKEELAYKFGLHFNIYENKNKLVEDMQSHGSPIRAIVNYEMIRGKTSGIINFLAKNDFKFSLVLCDEAHKMRNKETQTYQGAEILMSRADSAVFLTATPMMIRTEDLYHLLHLLDSTRYYERQIFLNRLQENRPFVEALTKISDLVPFADIKKDLENEIIRISFSLNEKEIFSVYTISEAFADDILYQEIIKVLNSEDNLKNRARLQYLMSSMSVMNNIFSRTRKREVTTDMSQAERKPHLHKVTLTKAERTEFDNVIEEYKDDNSYTDSWGEEVLTPGAALGLVQKKRQVASSVYAYLNTEADLDNGIDKFEEYPDAKFDELIRIINEVFKHGTKKIIVFALFRKTLKYLQIRFRKRGFGTLMIHGMVKDKSDVLDEFKNNPEAHILLSSEVGSEGLDMQFCNSMVNYDLPWNPMVVEQRIGRIDRFGQKSPIVNIYNVVVADSIQEEVYTRLLDRIGIFRGTIGDIEAILDAPLERGGTMTIQEAYSALEKELYTSRLTEEEKQRKFAEIELAIANEKENIKHLEKELDNSFTSDAYFQEEIKRIQQNNAYVTESELKNYLESAIRREMTTCYLEKVDEDVYEFHQPPSNLRALPSFLTKYQPYGDENQVAFGLFKAKIENKSVFRITFNQQAAYYDNKLVFINIYHPIIKACLNCFLKHDEPTKTSFCYALKSDELLHKGETYYLIVYQINVTRLVAGVPKRMERLLPLLYSANERKVVCDEELASHVFSRTQIEGYEHNHSKADIDNEMIQDMRYDFAERIAELKGKQIAEMKLQIDSDIQRNKKQIINYYDFLINNQQNYIKKYEAELLFADEKEARKLQNSIRLTNGKIKRYEQEKEYHLTQLQEASHVEFSEYILSLTLIHII